MSDNSDAVWYKRLLNDEIAKNSDLRFTIKSLEHDLVVAKKENKLAVKLSDTLVRQNEVLEKHINLLNRELEIAYNGNNAFRS